MELVLFPKRLDEKLNGKVQERIGFFPEELVVELLSTALDEKPAPGELVEHYNSLSEAYLARAKELLDSRDLPQTSGKLWGCAVLTIKMMAAKAGLKLDNIAEIWDFVEKLSAEREDDDLLTVFHVANSLRWNRDENLMNLQAVEAGAANVDRLIAKFREAPAEQSHESTSCACPSACYSSTEECVPPLEEM